ncbi:hypothetical protein A4G19_03815 [Pasteurellaceae bacterium Macca]|nr:hypothetical protein [Pasteurellaceae bacterium Macca]
MLAQAKANKLADINRQAQVFVDAIADTNTTPDFERETWQEQANEAKAWKADATSPTPVLETIASARGIPLDILREKAYEKAIGYQLLGATVAGQRQALEDRLKAAQSLEEVKAIEVTFTMEAVSNA